MLMLA